MTWHVINLTGLGLLFLGILLLIWSLFRGGVSVLGLGLVIVGFLIEVVTTIVGKLT